MTRLVLHIDRLVLRGVARADAPAVAAALQGRLAELMRADPQLAAQLAAAGDRSRLRPARVSLVPGSGAAALGRRVAATVAWRLRP